MKRLHAAAAAMIAAILCAGTCAAGDISPAIRNKIAAVEKSLVIFDPGAPAGQPPALATLAERMAHYKIPGVSIALIDGDEIEWARSYGTIKAESGTPVRTDSLFQAASTTKMLVAAVALRLVEKGVLDLDADINQYLKRWKVPENAFTREKKVTLRLLLTHRAGMPMTNFGYDDNTIPSLVQVLEGAAPARNKPAQVESTPGSQWGYSNIGYVVIQLLLEDVTGKPLARIMQETVFTPLHMNSSTLVYPLARNLQKREATPHDKEGKAGEPAMHPTALAQGGLVTTPSDLAKFTIEMMQAFRGESNKILSQSMMGRMFHREAEIEAKWMGVPLGQGLGVFLDGQGRDFSFGHPGENYPGSTCWVTGIPDVGKGLVVMTNGAAGSLLAMEILAAVRWEYQWPAGQ